LSENDKSSDFGFLWYVLIFVLMLHCTKINIDNFHYLEKLEKKLDELARK